MAEAGVPLRQGHPIKFEGDGMMAGMMNKMGGLEHRATRSPRWSTEPLADELFAIPAGYKVEEAK